MTNRFQCIKCGYVTNRLSNYNAHLNRKMPCDLSKRTIQKPQSEVCQPIAAVEQRKKTIYNCDICGLTFANRQNRNRHKKNVKCKPQSEVCQPIAAVEQAAILKAEKEAAEQIRALQEEILMLQIRQKGFTESVKKRVASGQAWKCNLCNCNLPHNYQVDHIQAVSLGGQNDISNAQALCKPCHQMKTKLDVLQLKSRKLSGRSTKDNLVPSDRIIGAVINFAADKGEEGE